MASAGVSPTTEANADLFLFGVDSKECCLFLVLTAIENSKLGGIRRVSPTTEANADLFLFGVDTKDCCLFLALTGNQKNFF
jgi:hypothetical protein